MISSAPDRHDEQRFKKLAVRIKRRRLVVLMVAFAAVAATIYAAFNMFQPILIAGDCMYPTLKDGQRCTLNRWAYIFSEPQCDDLVVYDYNGQMQVGRIKKKPDASGGEYYILPDTVQAGSKYYISIESIIGKINIR